jgi:hypothetical protein
MSATARSEDVLSTKEILLPAIKAFESWLESNGDSSFDPYDVWGTRYGLKARRLYYGHHPLGLPLIAPLLLLEIIFPAWRKAVVKRNRFATADAQLLLGFLNLYHATGNDRYLAKARQLGEQLLDYSVPGYSGLCWGYPFDWQNQRGMWGRNTPFITCTPYCYEAYCALAEATGDDEPLASAESIASFIFHDLHDTPAGPGAAAASYSPHDDSRVINASAYRAWVLFDATGRFARPDFLEKAQQNLNFILQNQRSDGSWLYAADEAGKFIDHFHTCFVLKNLLKICGLENGPDLMAVIRSGYDFYRQKLFDADGLPRSFAIKPRTGIVRLEMYDFAEAITLGTLLRNEIPEAYKHAQELAELLCREYQLPDGHFVTRVYVGGIRHTFPFLRWPQSQLFLALTNLYASSADVHKSATSTPIAKISTNK